MKKILVVFLTAILLTFAPLNAVCVESPEHISVETYETSSTTVHFEDGSYMVTVIRQSPITSSTRSTRSATYTKVGEKIVNLYDSKDNLQWTHTVTGTFKVNEGVSVVCTSSTYSSVIYEKAWSLAEHENSYSDNIAYGTAIYKRKVLFITTNTHKVVISIGCDINGNMD